MDSDEGFDIFAPLAQTPENQARYEQFINAVLEIYKRRLDDGANADDETVRTHKAQRDWGMEAHPDTIRVNPTADLAYVEFCVGEHPRLPRHCAAFLRFSSTVSDSANIGRHIRVVQMVAKTHFGDRVYGWSERHGRLYVGRHGCYSWTEVNGAVERAKANGKEGEDVEDTETANAAENNVEAENDAGPDTLVAATAPLYEVVPVPGKGKGVVACVDIPQGTRIMCEEPLFRFPAGYADVEEAEAIVLQRVRALTRDQQRAFFALHNEMGSDMSISPVLGTYITNALPLGDNGDGGLFLQVARINHACRPNTQHIWNPVRGCITVHALEAIAAGTEVTISYIDSLAMPYAERRRHFASNFGFFCRCPALCDRGPLQILASDFRLDTINRLTDETGRLDAMQANPPRALRGLRKLLGVLAQESLRGHRPAVAYWRAANAAAAIRDKARTSAFAHRAHGASRTAYGDDHPVTAEAKRMIARPVENELFGTAKAVVDFADWRPPQGLSAEAFDEWLWDTSSWV